MPASMLPARSRTAARQNRGVGNWEALTVGWASGASLTVYLRRRRSGALLPPGGIGRGMQIAGTIAIRAASLPSEGRGPLEVPARRRWGRDQAGSGQARWAGSRSKSSANPKDIAGSPSFLFDARRSSGRARDQPLRADPEPRPARGRSRFRTRPPGLPGFGGRSWPAVSSAISGTDPLRCLMVLPAVDEGVIDRGGGRARCQ
jgi:hypothetical protein